jgi:hypothetical protein
MMEMPIPGPKVRGFQGMTAPNGKLCRREPQKAISYTRPRRLRDHA